jgi:GAF domain/ANTAR domain
VSEVSASLRHVHALVAAERVDPDATDGTAERLDRLCRAAARALPATGVGVSLLDPDGFAGVVASSDAISAVIEEMQFTLGEGPCHDAHATRRPVLVPDLEAGHDRWPLYVQAVSDHEIHAVFAFPLQVGAARLGALDVYQREAGPLVDPGLAQALTFAEVATSFLIDGQAGLEGDQVDPGLEEALQHGYQLHQAQGMVMVMLDVNAAEALVRLRAYAYANERRLSDVVEDIVARRLRLDKDQQQ